MKVVELNKRKNCVGLNIRLARLRAKPAVTQSDLSAKLQIMGVNIERTAISKIESGSRLVTDYEVKAIAKALSISIDQLFYSERNSK